MFKKDENGQYLQQTQADGTKHRYIKGRVLGKGGFAKCYQIIDDNTKNRYACKIIQKQLLTHKKLKQKLQSQILIHKKVCHQNIVKFQHVFEDEQFIYILLELCINNTLNQLLIRRKQLTEVQVRYYVYHLLLAIVYLHEDHIIHRDIKLDNFFLSEHLQIKIGDFGLATQIETQHKKKSICGTPIYIAPEIVDAKQGYSYQIDIWSLGIATFVLLYGRFPFDGSDIKDITARIKCKSYLASSFISEQAKSFISKMLQINPCERFTAKQLLGHQFLSNHQIPKLLPRSSLACPPNSNFLDEYRSIKNKKTLSKNNQQEQEFHFMLCSKESSLQESHRNIPKIKQSPQIIIVHQDNKQNLIDSRTVRKVFSQVNDSLDKNQNIQINTWIQQFWQSPNYGLMYKTSDYVIGMRFNDATNLISYLSNTFFIFVTSQGKQINYNLQIIPKKQIPKQIYSKIKIFIKLLKEINLNSQQTIRSKVYIKRYLFGLNMSIIWLSNGLLQAKFSKGNHLIISSFNCLHITKDKAKKMFIASQLNQQTQQIISEQKQLSQQIKRICRLMPRQISNIG